MKIVTLIIAIIGAITGIIAIVLQHLDRRFKLTISAPTWDDFPNKGTNKFPSYIWCSDYEVCVDHVFLIHSKWMRIINKSASSIVIYSIEMVHPRGVKLEASSHMRGADFDFNDFDNSNAQISYDNDIFRDKKLSIEKDPLILSDAKFPLFLKPYDVFEGFVFFRGFHSELLKETDVIITTKTSRGKKEIYAKLNFFEGDA